MKPNATCQSILPCAIISQPLLPKNPVLAEQEDSSQSEDADSSDDLSIEMARKTKLNSKDFDHGDRRRGRGRGRGRGRVRGRSRGRGQRRGEDQILHASTMFLL